MKTRFSVLAFALCFILCSCSHVSPKVDRTDPPLFSQSYGVSSGKEQELPSSYPWENSPSSGSDSPDFSSFPSPTPASPTPDPTPTPVPTPTPEPFVPFTIAFTGDINLAENYRIYPHAQSKGRTIEQCFSSAILERMRAADLLLVNCESSVSDRGSALKGKAYTFRTSTKTAQEFKTMGADLIGLANNHVYDFGKDAFLDTLDTFRDMGLPTVGAGRNAAEAYEPYYYEMSGMTVAIIATSRAEKQYYTIVAEEDVPGICGCYDETLVCEKIAEAKTKADFVIVYVHYGYEGTTQIEEAQRDASYHFVEAGADLIVGGHSHCLQGIDSHMGKPIFYSLGNYLFNLTEMPTALLELTFESRDHYTLRILPCMQTDGMVVDQFSTSKGKDILQSLRDLSFGIAIDREGYVSVAFVNAAENCQTVYALLPEKVYTPYAGRFSDARRV